MDVTYHIVEDRLAELRDLLAQLEAEIARNPSLTFEPAGHPAKRERASLRDRIALLQEMLYEADHS